MPTTVYCCRVYHRGDWKSAFCIFSGSWSCSIELHLCPALGKCFCWYRSLARVFRFDERVVTHGLIWLSSLVKRQNVFYFFYNYRKNFLASVPSSGLGIGFCFRVFQRNPDFYVSLVLFFVFIESLLLSWNIFLLQVLIIIKFFIISYHRSFVIRRATGLIPFVISRHVRIFQHIPCFPSALFFAHAFLSLGVHCN